MWINYYCECVLQLALHIHAQEWSRAAFLLTFQGNWAVYLHLCDLITLHIEYWTRTRNAAWPVERRRLRGHDVFCLEYCFYHLLSILLIVLPLFCPGSSMKCGFAFLQWLSLAACCCFRSTRRHGFWVLSLAPWSSTVSVQWGRCLCSMKYNEIGSHHGGR